MSLSMLCLATHTLVCPWNHCKLHNYRIFRTRGRTRTPSIISNKRHCALNMNVHKRCRTARNIAATVVRTWRSSTYRDWTKNDLRSECCVRTLNEQWGVTVRTLLFNWACFYNRGWELLNVWLTEWSDCFVIVIVWWSLYAGKVKKSTIPWQSTLKSGAPGSAENTVNMLQVGRQHSSQDFPHRSCSLVYHCDVNGERMDSKDTWTYRWNGLSVSWSSQCSSGLRVAGLLCCKCPDDCWRLWQLFCLQNMEHNKNQ